MAYSKNIWVDLDTTKPLSATRLNKIETGIEEAQATADSALSLTQTNNSNVPGGVLLDSFTDANDDAKLTSALTYAAAQTYPPAIMLTNRAHSFTTANRTAFEGMRIIGADGYSNPERNSGTKVATRVTLNFTGPWFHNGGVDKFGVTLRNLSFTGSSTASVLGMSGSGTWYCLAMSGIYSSGLRTVLGTQALKLLVTAGSFTGDWEINNCYNGAFHMGGSDNVFWSDGMLIDSGTAFNSAGSANGQFHIWLDFMEKSYVGPIYMTAEGPWNGIKITGPAFNGTNSNQGGPINFFGMRVEGRNGNQPCNGALIRQEGGIAIIRDSWVAYGMASPATPGHSPADKAIIHQEGGSLLVSGCTYDTASGVAETVPFIYSNSTGDAVVNGIMRAAKGGAWTGRPRAARPVANSDNYIADATVTKVTV